MALRPGESTPVMRTPEGYRILKLITREPAGQRDLSDPKVQQTIRETLINRKDQLLKAAYYEMARNEAKVVNYFVERDCGENARRSSALAIAPAFSSSCCLAHARAGFSSTALASALWASASG